MNGLTNAFHICAVVPTRVGNESEDADRELRPSQSFCFPASFYH